MKIENVGRVARLSSVRGNLLADIADLDKGLTVRVGGRTTNVGAAARKLIREDLERELKGVEAELEALGVELGQTNHYFEVVEGGLRLRMTSFASGGFTGPSDCATAKVVETKILEILDQRDRKLKAELPGFIQDAMRRGRII